MYLSCQLVLGFAEWTAVTWTRCSSANKMFQIINSITLNQDINEVQKLVAGLNCI